MVSSYVMLARPVGRFFTVLHMNFPVMLIAEGICGLWVGLCWYADIGIGLAPQARICSIQAIDTSRCTYVPQVRLPVSLAHYEYG